MDDDGDLANRVTRGAKAGHKGYSWYSRLTTTKKILLWLISLAAVLGIALGVGLGVGLGGNSNDNDNDNEND